MDQTCNSLLLACSRVLRFVGALHFQWAATATVSVCIARLALRFLGFCLSLVGAATTRSQLFAGPYRLRVGQFQFKHLLTPRAFVGVPRRSRPLDQCGESDWKVRTGAKAVLRSRLDS